MKVLYFDCSSGISGNMTLGALMELIDDPDYLQKELAKLKQKLLSDLSGEEIQLLTVSRPSAYTEYEPFYFMDTPDHFAQEVKNSFS